MTKLLQERLYPEISDFVYNTILDVTTVNGKANAFTKWVCQQYLDGHFKGLDDGDIIRVNELLQSYKKYTTKLKPIMDYLTVEDLEDAINAVSNAGYKTRAEFVAAARKGAKQVYKDNEYIILKINSWAAAKKYGANTRWCISTRNDDETFNYYYQKANGEIYFIINRLNSSCKYACVSNVCYDEYDDILFVLSDDGQIREQYGDAGELACRLSDSKNLINVFPYAFPSFDKKYVIDNINKTANGDFIPQDEDF